ncbi:MAG: hypothetical protein ACP5DZ_05485 [Bacteroidales bacterium]
MLLSISHDEAYLRVKENIPHKCTASHQFKVFAQKAGLSDDITFHSLRHTFAVRHWVEHRDIVRGQFKMHRKSARWPECEFFF